MKKQTITLRRLTAEEFENYFDLNAPGWRLAIEAEAAGELDTALAKLEAVCLLNKLYMMNLQNRIMVELGAFGTDKVEHYLGLDSDDRVRYMIQILGQEKSRVILREVVVQTREEACIGQNDKATPKRRL